jgi:hypothetical protein
MRTVVSVHFVNLKASCSSVRNVHLYLCRTHTAVLTCYLVKCCIWYILGVEIMTLVGGGK